MINKPYNIRDYLGLGQVMHHSEANLVWNPSRVVILITIFVSMATEWFADKLAYFVKNNDFSTNFAGNDSKKYRFYHNLSVTTNVPCLISFYINQNLGILDNY